MKKNKQLLEQTTNRREFNRRYKKYLENIGKINCSYCKYHCGDNQSNGKKWYGGFDFIKNLKHPNWKLVTKNKKQWMKKKIKIKINVIKTKEIKKYFEIIF